ECLCRWLSAAEFRMEIQRQSDHRRNKLVPKSLHFGAVKCRPLSAYGVEHSWSGEDRSSADDYCQTGFAYHRSAVRADVARRGEHSGLVGTDEFRESAR